MSKQTKKAGVVSRIFKGIGIFLLIAVLLLAGFFGFLVVTEYKPADLETSLVEGTAAETLSAGSSLKLLTWNIGFGALGDNADFFMDGGTMVNTADEARVNSNMAGICSFIEETSPDILFLQEIDRDSARSYHISEYGVVGEQLPEYCSSFANNFKVAFLPYPIPPIGKVDSGIATFSNCGVTSAERVQLPIPFSWPIRMINLKRCLLVSRIPVEGTDKELVLVNLHLEAYDNGEGKIAQTKMLADLLEAEGEKGNYVIAGGDFNQTFPGVDKETYTIIPGLWAAGDLDISEFSDDWQFVTDVSLPTCRSLDRVYAGADKENFQYYYIDGFIVSENVRVDSVETQDLDFVSSDHNPVLMEFTLE